MYYHLMIHTECEEYATCVHTRVADRIRCQHRPLATGVNSCWSQDIDEDDMKAFAAAGNVHCPNYINPIVLSATWARRSCVEILIQDPRVVPVDAVKRRDKFLADIRAHGFMLFPDMEAMKRAARLALLCMDTTMVHYLLGALTELYKGLPRMTRRLCDGIFAENLLPDTGLTYSRKPSLVLGIRYAWRMRRFYPQVLRMRLGEEDIELLGVYDIVHLADYGVPVSLLISCHLGVGLELDVLEKVSFYAQLAQETRRRLHQMKQRLNHDLFEIGDLLNLIADYCICDDEEVFMSAHQAIALYTKAARKRSLRSYDEQRELTARVVARKRMKLMRDIGASTF